MPRGYPKDKYPKLYAKRRSRKKYYRPEAMREEVTASHILLTTALQAVQTGLHIVEEAMQSLKR